MKIQHTFLAALGCLILLTTALPAQVPNLLNYQGRIAVGTPPVNFNGTGQFKFALVAPRDSVRATATAVLTGGSVTSINLTNAGAGYPPGPVSVTISGGGGSGAFAGALATGGGGSVLVNFLNGGSGFTSPPTVVFEPPPTATHVETLWTYNGTGSLVSSPPVRQSSFR